MLVQYIMSSSRVGGRLNKYPEGPAPTLREGTCDVVSVTSDNGPYFCIQCNAHTRANQMRKWPTNVCTPKSFGALLYGGWTVYVYVAGLRNTSWGNQNYCWQSFDWLAALWVCVNAPARHGYASGWHWCGVKGLHFRLREQPYESQCPLVSKLVSLLVNNFFKKMIRKGKER